MRIAHLMRKYDPSEWGGTESAVLQLTTDLAKRGVGSVIYAPKLPMQTESVDPFAATDCAIRRFRARVPVWGISAERRAQMIAVGGNLISLGLMGSLWSEENIDVIHSHAQGRLGAVGRIVARGRRLPFVISIHGGIYDLPAEVRQELRNPAVGGWDWGRPLGFILRARHLMDQADAIITFNPREAALIRERHPGRRVLTEPHGVPTELLARESRSSALEAFPELRGRSVLLVLGRIDPVKNQEWLVAEAAELARRHPEVLMVFVGAVTNRDYGSALAARIAREDLQGTVKILGCLPFGDPRLIGLLQEARAVLVPSKSETFGIVIVEAWAAGTPVISSRTSGASALVEEGVNGLLFDLDRPATFHSAVDRVLDQPRLAAQWGAAGRAKAAAEFDTSVRAERMRRLYETLIEEKNALRHTKRR
jgi:glycosyltransferase involved in cell wall biosynthesis